MKKSISETITAKLSARIDYLDRNRGKLIAQWGQRPWQLYCRAAKLMRSMTYEQLINLYGYTTPMRPTHAAFEEWTLNIEPCEEDELYLAHSWLAEELSLGRNEVELREFFSGTFE